jgi:crotonobetainyl-CoA:carnitine CoA-transferase CaiB-like acyl-CoA transferase
MARALEGIRVLDLTQWLQGPVCAQYLADFGAEVIHIERPVTGDGARGVRSIKALPVGDWNQYFLVINRNKKSLAIDLKQEEGQELFYELVAKSDVFLSNYQMENLRAWGLTYEKLREVNPRLVYATNTGYGHAIEVNRPSYDINVQALTGIMTRQGEPGQPPIYLGMGSGDTYGGIMSAFGIMLALYQRRRTGVGQSIDASLYGAQLFMGAPTLQPFLASRNELYATQQSRRRAGNPLWNRYQAKDKWLFLCEENTDENWSKLCQSLDQPELAADVRFDSPAKRAENRSELIEILDGRLKERTAEEWLDRWTPAGIVASPIQNLKEVSEDPQAWENDYFVKAHCDEVNREVDVRGLPLTLSKTPGSVETLGPELGQDTEIILFETLGIDWDRIGELKERGVIP